MLAFVREETGERGKKPSQQGENQQQTQPTYGSGLESNRGHIGERQALWPLCHPCFLEEVADYLTWEKNGKTITQSKLHLGFPLEKKKNLTLSSPPAGVTAPPLLIEGGTISGLKVWGGSAPMTFWWIRYIARANCSEFKRPWFVMSQSPLKVQTNSAER